MNVRSRDLNAIENYSCPLHVAILDGTKRMDTREILTVVLYALARHGSVELQHSLLELLLPMHEEVE